MKLVSGIIIATTLITALAAHTMAQDAATSSTQPTEWDMVWGTASITIKRTAENRGMRIVSVDWANAADTDLFNVVLVKNTGDYYVKDWWWYPYLDADQLVAKINEHHARIQHLAVRGDGSGKHHFSAVLVDNTGANAKTWWWYFNVTPTYLSSLAEKNKARIVEVATYFDLQKNEIRRAGVMIANTGVDKKEWTYLSDMSDLLIQPLINFQQMQIINLAVVNFGGIYDVLLEKGPGHKTYTYLHKDAVEMMKLAHQNKARIYFQQSGSSSPGAPVIMIENGPLPKNCGQKTNDRCCQGYYCSSGMCDAFSGRCANAPQWVGSGCSTGGNSGGNSGGGNNPPPCGTSAGAKCCPKDQCKKGFACDVGSQKCAKVGPGCGGIGQACCPGSSANPDGCSLSKCSAGVCQPCGNKGEICCGGTTTSQFCGPALTCNGVDCH